MSIRRRFRLRGGEVRQQGIIPNRTDQIEKLAAKLSTGARRVNCAAKPALVAMAGIGN
jgi:hypothetical protein